MIFYLLFIFLFVSSTLGTHVEEGTEWNLEKDSGLFQGDIVLTEKQHAAIFGSPDKSRPKRQIYFDTHWPDEYISFEYDTTMTSEAKYLVRQAMAYITARTCLKFREDPKAKDRILIIFDRVNFKKYTEFTTWNAVPFEYGSVMMYASRPISQSKEKIYLGTMGTRLITFYDMMAVNANHECSCPPLDCKNGGVPNPGNCSECFCPEGYGGRLCDSTPKEFSKKLTALSTWQNYTVTFGLPNLLEQEYKRLNILIQAPDDKTIQVQVIKIEGFSCWPVACSYNGFEVKWMGDPRITNPL
uniref:Astacin domain-containing protein n=1 Tax=Caenorhabditis tropicalis TaxID=1561998 RepID=A0A1I7UE04_9PELO